MNPSLFIGYQKALLTGISLPMEMISSARSIARIKRNRSTRWNCFVVSGFLEQLEAIQFANGIKVLPSHSLSTAPPAHTVFIPPIWGNPEVVIEKHPALIEWIVDQYHAGTKLVATGTGVCLLAHAGLLDNKIATTHWYYFDQFEKKYPKVNLQKKHFITQDGDITCTGSINALVDLVVYLIETEFGKEVSQIIEQHYSHEINRTYDKPWFDKSGSRHPDEGIVEVQQWMQKNFNQSFDLPSLSRMANMSSRNFSRRFKSAVGKSPLAYGVDLKIHAAQELLRDTNLSHQEISEHLGYKDNGFFARQFKQKTHLTPRQYREMVRGKLFEAQP
ncbi:MAG: helix-turn-helix domain-containing protein [Kangiellaceae bacterium]|jgi:transcriptional regulator GlxA family with amidase domain